MADILRYGKVCRGGNTAPSAVLMLPVFVLSGVVTTQSQDIDAAATSGHGSSNSTTAHHRYHVFHFDFDNVEAAYVVSLWIFIASLAKIG